MHVIHVSHVYGSLHGGSLFSTAMIEILRASGADVTLVAERFEDNDAAARASSRRVVLRHLFRSGLSSWFMRLPDIARLWRLALTSRCPLVLVQGDLPRLNYVLLQFLVPLLFIRQDGVLTCPANHRFLQRSRTICHKPGGFSCLAVHAREHCFGELSLVHRLGRIVYRLRDMMLLRCLRHFVGNSEYLARRHGRSGAVLHPPTLTTLEPAQEAKHNLRRIVFCGRLAPEKGADEAIRILTALPDDYHLEIIGDGPQKSRLLDLCCLLGVEERVQFPGWLTPQERDATLATAGVLVMPSLCDEAFGMAGIEAFAQGTPVVAYAVGGIAEWCAADAGMLVPCGDITAAAQAVLALTRDPARWESASAAARRVATTQFPVNRFRGDLLALIQRETGLALS